jgi:hypothetical protein
MTNFIGTTRPRVIPATAATPSLPDSQDGNILFVYQGSTSPGAEDGSQANPYTTIADALTAAVALTPTAASPVLIKVWAGIYDEELTWVDHVYMQGQGAGVTILEETGGNVPLTIGVASCGFANMTVRNTQNAAIVSVNVATGSSFVLFEGCRFTDAGDNAEVFAIAGGATVVFNACTVTATGEGVDILTCSAGTLRAYNSYFLGEIVLSGTGGVDFIDCEVEGTIAGGGTGDFKAYASYFHDSAAAAIAFTAAPGELVLLGNHFDADGDHDITSTVDISDAEIYDNSMDEGLDETIIRDDDDWNVGGGSDFYSDLQTAFNALDRDGVHFNLWAGETPAAQYVIPAYEIYINGNGRLIDRANERTFNIANATNLTIRDLRINSDVRMTASGATLVLEHCDITNGCVFVSGDDATSVVRLLDCHCTAGTDYCLQFENTQQLVTEVIRCYMKGAAGNPAVYWSGNNDQLRIRHSTIMHGDLGANVPFGRSAAQTPDVTCYQSTFNVTPWGAVWTNLINAAQRLTTLDAEANY